MIIIGNPHYGTYTIIVIIVIGNPLYFLLLKLAHNAAVTCSVFAPKPNIILEQLHLQQLESTNLEHDSSLFQDPCEVGAHLSPNKVIYQ